MRVDPVPALVGLQLGPQPHGARPARPTPGPRAPGAPARGRGATRRPAPTRPRPARRAPGRPRRRAAGTRPPAGPTRPRSGPAARPAAVTVCPSPSRTGSRARPAARGSGRTCGPASGWWRATFCRSCSVSRSSRACRSAHRACSSRSAQPWQGCARSARRSVASSGSSAAEPRAPLPDRPRCAVAGAAMPVLRSDDARSRRTCGRAVVDVLGQPHPAQRRRPGSGSRAADSRPAQRSSVSTSGRGSSPSVTPGSRTTASPARRPAGTAMTSPGRSARQRRPPSASRCSACALPAQRLLPLGEPRGAARRTRRSRRGGSASSRCVPGEGLGVAVDLPGQPDHRPVGLELRERLLQQLAGRRAAEPADQVDRHVVAGPERDCAAGRCGWRPGRRPARGSTPGLPEHHGVALDVDAAAAGPPGELGVLPRRQVGVRLAVELDQPLEHHGAGRHVDAQRQGLGGEDGLDQPADEQLLDGLLERRQHPGVVGGEPALAAPRATPSSRARPGRPRAGRRCGGRRPRRISAALVRRWSAAAPAAGTARRRRRSRRG